MGPSGISSYLQWNRSWCLSWAALLRVCRSQSSSLPFFCEKSLPLSISAGLSERHTNNHSSKIRSSSLTQGWEWYCSQRLSFPATCFFFCAFAAHDNSNQQRVSYAGKSIISKDRNCLQFRVRCLLCCSSLPIEIMWVPSTRFGLGRLGSNFSISV